VKRPKDPFRKHTHAFLRFAGAGLSLDNIADLERQLQILIPDAGARSATCAAELARIMSHWDAPPAHKPTSPHHPGKTVKIGGTA